jgi:hypothetical protein
MEWTGGLPLGLFVGRRMLMVTARDDGAEFWMELKMGGPMAGMVLKSLGDRQPEIDSFAAGLKGGRGGRSRVSRRGWHIGAYNLW